MIQGLTLAEELERVEIEKEAEKEFSPMYLFPSEVIECERQASRETVSDLEYLAKEFGFFVWITKCTPTTPTAPPIRFDLPSVRVELGSILRGGSGGLAFKPTGTTPAKTKADARNAAVAAALPELRRRCDGLDAATKADRDAAKPSVRLAQLCVGLGWARAPETRGERVTIFPEHVSRAAPVEGSEQLVLDRPFEGPECAWCQLGKAELAALRACRALEARFGKAVLDALVSDSGAPEAAPVVRRPSPRRAPQTVVRGAGEGVLASAVATSICGGDPAAGASLSRGGWRLTGAELEALAARVVGKTALWATSSSGVVTAVDALGADEAIMGGFKSDGGITFAAWHAAQEKGSNATLKAVRAALEAYPAAREALEEAESSGLVPKRKLRFPAFPLLTMADGAKLPLETARILDDLEAAAAPEAAPEAAPIGGDGTGGDGPGGDGPGGDGPGGDGPEPPAEESRGAAADADLEDRLFDLVRAQSDGRLAMSQLKDRFTSTFGTPFPLSKHLKKKVEALIAATMTDRLEISGDALRLGPGYEAVAPAPASPAPARRTLEAETSAPGAGGAKSDGRERASDSGGDVSFLGDEHEDLLSRNDDVAARLGRIGWASAAHDHALGGEESRSSFFDALGYGHEAFYGDASPYDASTACFWIRLDGQGFTAWSKRHGVDPCFDSRVSGAFVSATRDAVHLLRTKGFDVVAAFTQSDEVTVLCGGPAVTHRGATDPRKKLETNCTSYLTNFFRTRLRERGIDAEDAFFDAKSFAAPSRAAGLANLIWRRLDATRNAASQTLRHVHGMTTLKVNHRDQRAKLADLGTPWASRPPAHTYGVLLLANDLDRELHLRLRVPLTAEDALGLETAVFHDRAWPKHTDSPLCAHHPERHQV